MQGAERDASEGEREISLDDMEARALMAIIDVAMCPSGLSTSSPLERSVGALRLVSSAFVEAGNGGCEKCARVSNSYETAARTGTSFHRKDDRSGR